MTNPRPGPQGFRRRAPLAALLAALLALPGLAAPAENRPQAMDPAIGKKKPLAPDASLAGSI